MSRGMLVLSFTLLTTGNAMAQMDAARMTEAEEIALARSAAPARVSDDADVWVLRGDGFERAYRGNNGNACMVQRGRHEGELKPTCYDSEAARTILPRNIREHELRAEGTSREEAAQILADELYDGTLIAPRRPAMVYMFSSGQRFMIDGELNRSKPHIMLYMPYLMGDDFGVPGPDEEIMVVREGTPNAFLYLATPEFVDPETPDAN